MYFFNVTELRNIYNSEVKAEESTLLKQIFHALAKKFHFVFYNTNVYERKIMIAGTSLISTMQKPSQNWQTQTTTPAIASVKVGEVVGDNSETPKKSFITRIIENLKTRLVQKRIAKLESIPPEKRTPTQQAELDANKQSVNFMI